MNTIWDRFSRPRSRIRSIAAPRRVHERIGARSTISGVFGPVFAGDGIAEQSFGAWPYVRGAEHQSLVDRDPQEVLQAGLRVGIACDEHLGRCWSCVRCVVHTGSVPDAVFGCHCLPASACGLDSRRRRCSGWLLPSACSAQGSSRLDYLRAGGDRAAYQSGRDRQARIVGARRVLA